MARPAAESSFDELLGHWTGMVGGIYRLLGVPCHSQALASTNLFAIGNSDCSHIIVSATVQN